ncbi:hypothetical protein [Kribbella sp. NPDC051718]|uniref:hypothetical protein n=1 Tax=Kribbella sp. NPDC051718 TaxID=3155168 RepID=UPI003444EAE5
MGANTSRQCSRVMFVGLGDLTKRVVDILLSAGFQGQLAVTARSDEAVVRHTNLVRYVGWNIGAETPVVGLRVDVDDVEKTAEAISQFDPDYIFMGASMHAARRILDLPGEITRRLDRAELGPWLPVHLSLNLKLSAAIEMAGSTAAVINGAYPDAVGPAMAAIGRAPMVGIGNVGNIIPGITYAASRLSGVPVAELQVKFVAHHYVSHRVHRFGDAGQAPYILSVTRRDTGKQVDVDPQDVFRTLAGPLRRTGGRDGQQLTAASAARLLMALTSEEPVDLHAPSPGGLPGGYPVRVHRGGVELALPDGIDLADAVAVNAGGQAADGILSISPSGEVQFAAEQMSIMRDILGYWQESMELDDCHRLAAELVDRVNRLDGGTR